MDAYCLLRFNYLCLRICLFSSFWGMLVLTPVYVLEGSEQEGSIYYITLANVASGSNTLVRRTANLFPFFFRLWVDWLSALFCSLLLFVAIDSVSTTRCKKCSNVFVYMVL